MLNKNKKTAFNSHEHGMNAISPLNKGEVHAGTDGIQVKLIDYPDEKRFKRALSKMVGATVGGDINEDIPPEVGEELFKGGLQTGLEAGVFTFEISGVSRAFTHQMVRTRKAAFHQQSSRYTFMGAKFNVREPKTIWNDRDAHQIFNNLVFQARKTYEKLCELGIPYQDARFAVPVGIETYIVAEYPIKVFLDTFAYRACPMFQWEMVEVMQRMASEVLILWPWMEPYIKISCEKTHKCMFQGFEETEEQCEFEWAGDRVFKSEHFSTDGDKK
jgi:thymidylate synthase (FAD)